MRIPLWVSYCPQFGSWQRASRRRHQACLPRAAEVLEYRLCLSAAPVVSSLSLQNDTGQAGDYLTHDPAITGFVSSDNSGGQVDIEIDFNADGIADDWTYGVSGTTFTYDPTVHLTYGQVTIAVRAGQADYGTSEQHFGDWVPITFTYQSALNDPPSIATLTLQNDTGEAGDNVTGDPALIGTVVNDGSFSGMSFEIDYDGDNTPDDWGYIAADGTFEFDPTIHISFGSVTVRVRAVETDSQTTETLYSDWASITFTYQAPPNDPPSVASLSLKNDTGQVGDNVTTDPTLTGSIQNDGPANVVGIHVDYNGDGTPDDWYYAAADGTFEFDPSTWISPGETTIWVRAFEDGPYTTETLNGEWTSITLTFDSGS